MPAQKLKRFLDENAIRYVSIQHSPAFTAQEVAARHTFPAGELAQTVVVKLDSTMALVVLPATRKLDLDQLEQVTGAHTASLAEGIAGHVSRLRPGGHAAVWQPVRDAGLRQQAVGLG